jgi:circadian clock protein KaiC
VLTGSARLSQQAEERAAALVEEQERERRQRALARLKTAFEAELAALQARFETEQADLASGISQHRARVERLKDDQREIAQSRRADAPNGDQRPKRRGDVGVKAR